MKRILIWISLGLLPFSNVTADSRFAWRLAQSAFIVSAAADVRTTQLGLEWGAIELNPILGSHPSTSRLYFTKTMATGAILYTSQYLWKSGRKKTAWTVLIVGTLLQSVAASRNHRTAR